MGEGWGEGERDEYPTRNAQPQNDQVKNGTAPRRAPLPPALLLRLGVGYSLFVVSSPLTLSSPARPVESPGRQGERERKSLPAGRQACFQQSRTGSFPGRMEIAPVPFSKSHRNVLANAEFVVYTSGAHGRVEFQAGDSCGVGRLILVSLLIVSRQVEIGTCHPNHHPPVLRQLRH